jgi:elongation factor G
MEFKSYDPVPPNVQQQIVERYKKSRAGIEEE